MKFKRLLSLLLAGAMLVSAAMFTGCMPEEEEDPEEEAKANGIVTLNMFIITEEETTEEAAKAVQLAINDITLSKYKTKIKINYLTEDKYWDAVEAETEAVIKAAEEAEAEKAAEEAREAALTPEERAAKEAEEKAAKKKAKEEAEELTPEEEMSNLDKEYDALYEVGDVIIEEPQIDIVLVNGYEKYVELSENGKLAPLDTYLSLESKILASYIYPAFLEAAKINNTTYGIPVNGPIGSCEYILFNKELLDKYGYKAEDMTDLVELEDYLRVIKANEPDVIPLGSASIHKGYDSYGSEYGTTGLKQTPTGLYEADEKLPGGGIISIYDQDDVKAHYKKINDYQKAGLLVADPEKKAGKKVAVEFRKGSAASIPVWEKEDGCEYVYSIYRAPVATNDDLLGSVFAISTYSLNKERSMEMIKLFNINPVLANLLQWGIEGVHYEYNKEEDAIDLLSNDYTMNTRYTGNRYIKYRLTSEPDSFEAYKEQNLGVELSPFYGYKFPFANTALEGEKRDPHAQEVIDNSEAFAKEAVNDLLTGEGNFEQKWETFKRNVNRAYRGRAYDVALEVKLVLKPYFDAKVKALTASIAGAGNVNEYISDLKAGLAKIHGNAYNEEAVDTVFTDTLKKNFAADRAKFNTSVEAAAIRLSDGFIDNWTNTFDRAYYVTEIFEIIDSMAEENAPADDEEVVITKTEFITKLMEQAAPVLGYYNTPEIMTEFDVLIPGHERAEEAEDSEEAPSEEAPVEEAPAEEVEADAEEADEGEDEAEAEAEAEAEIPAEPEVDPDLIEDMDAYVDEIKAAVLELTEEIGYDYTYDSVIPLIKDKLAATFPELNADALVAEIDDRLVAGGMDTFRKNFMLADFKPQITMINEKRLAEMEEEGKTLEDMTEESEEAEEAPEEAEEETAEGEESAEAETEAETEAEAPAEGETEAEAPAEAA